LKANGTGLDPILAFERHLTIEVLCSKTDEKGQSRGWWSNRQDARGPQVSVLSKVRNFIGLEVKPTLEIGARQRQLSSL
jgi:hypothetical protein